jgi:hypothetical protein
MKYLYTNNKFNLKHWLMQWVSIPIDIFHILLKILTLNLVWFDFPVDWEIWKLKNTK